MGLKLHREGRWRAWLGARFGGDAVLGDRVWRRCLHLFGTAVLLYYLLPPHLVPVLSTEALLLISLGLVLLLEFLRHAAGVELPTIRDHEAHRVASYTWFAVGLVVAVLLFPRPIAVAAVLGTAIVDPLIGELRVSSRFRGYYPALPLLVYFVLAVGGFRLSSSWHLFPALGLAALMAGLGVAVESPKHPMLDDDLTMTLVPGVLMMALVLLASGLPTLGP